MHRQGCRNFDRGDAVLDHLLHLLERAHLDLAYWGYKLSMAEELLKITDVCPTVCNMTSIMRRRHWAVLFSSRPARFLTR
jgi:hypothetical protein